MSFGDAGTWERVQLRLRGAGALPGSRAASLRRGARSPGPVPDVGATALVPVPPCRPPGGCWTTR